MGAMARTTYEKASQVRLKASIDTLVQRGEPIFQKLSKTDITSLMANCSLQRYHKGENVVQQGESGEMLYGVESGNLHVTIDGLKVRTVDRGDYFGEAALLANEPRSSTVSVQSGFAELWAVGRTNF